MKKLLYIEGAILIAVLLLVASLALSGAIRLKDFGSATSPDSTQATDPVTEPTDPSTAPTDPGPLPEHSPVDGSYFDDAVFIGDSVSMKLSFYEAAMNKLGKAQFLVAGSLGSGNALWPVSNQSVHPTYNGVKMRLEDSVPLTGAKKLYIMLGMNDLALYGPQGAADNLVTLLDLILAKTPGIEIFIQSMTPVAKDSTIVSADGLNNDKVRAYNALLLETALKRGWNFVDVASVMFDSEGHLIESYCSDLGGMGCHFTNAGCEAWVRYLLTHTKQGD